jgi:hypothetical protein
MSMEALLRMNEPVPRINPTGDYGDHAKQKRNCRKSHDRATLGSTLC